MKFQPTHMAHIVLVSLVAILSGCGTINKTSEELISNASIKQKYCYSQPTKEVDQRVKEFLQKCYWGGESGTYANGTFISYSGLRTLSEQVDGRPRYLVRNDLLVSYVADILPSEGVCQTEVRMYAVTSLWSKTIAAVDQNIKTNDAVCSR